jgi:hypothetical protein
MASIHITRTPDQGLAEYEQLRRAVGDEPIDGQREHHVGVVDGALVIADVWESRAHADRFAAERLLPAFDQSAVDPRADTMVLAFDQATQDA